VTRFWLIRHGEPDTETRNRCYGALDIGLSEEGRRQMARVARHLATEPLGAIYTSPRNRALESASILASSYSCLVEMAPDLREIDFGDFEGLTYDEIALRYPDLYRQWMETPTAIRFPNGESFAEVRLRATRAFEEIRRKHQEQTVALVSHGGVIRIILAHALQMPHHCIFRLAQHHAAMNLLTYMCESPCVELLNGLPAVPKDT